MITQGQNDDFVIANLRLGKVFIGSLKLSQVLRKTKWFEHFWLGEQGGIGNDKLTHELETSH